MRMINQGETALIKIYVTSDDHVTAATGHGTYAALLALDNLCANIDSVLQWRGAAGNDDLGYSGDGGNGYKVSFVAGGALAINEAASDETIITFEDGVTTAAELDAFIDANSARIMVAIADTGAGGPLTTGVDVFTDEILDHENDDGDFTVWIRRGNERWKELPEFYVTEALATVTPNEDPAPPTVTIGGKGEYIIHLNEEALAVIGGTDNFEGEISFLIEADTGWDEAMVKVQVSAGTDANVVAWKGDVPADLTPSGLVKTPTRWERD